MKLALIVPGGFDRNDRIIPALHDLTQELGHRHEVHVFSEEGESSIPRYRLAGAEIHQLTRDAGGPASRPSLVTRTMKPARIAWRLLRELQAATAAARFDVFHAFWVGNAALVAAMAARRVSVPLVLSIGGGEAAWLPDIGYGGAGSWTGRARVQTAIRLASTLTAGSAFAARCLPGDLAERARIIPLGVRPEIFSPPAAARPPGPPWRLLQVADLNLVKDHETALHALRDVVSRLGEVSMDFVGEDTRDGYLARMAASLGLGARARFHGFVPRGNLPALFHRAHLHVISSRYESQGVSILEAAATGLPTVGTAVGLLPTLSPTAARCVPPGDPTALADAICASLRDDSGREAMGTAALLWASSHDACWTAKVFEEVYASLLC